MGKQNFLLIWNPTEKEVDCNILFVVIYARKSKKKKKEKKGVQLFILLWFWDIVMETFQC